ncbi:MAG: Gfo/Idh/MocA family oxidoreductase [Planctomycetes bacterium]|nr:Gfo/Idh/MocA family oxidoreductase [Planctomycetota bacterium]
MAQALVSRRSVLKSGVLALATGWLPSREGRAAGFREANERPRVGAIGTGSRWCQRATGINGPWGSAPDFRKYGDYVAVCDVDRSRRQRAAALVKDWTGVEVPMPADYRAILDDPKVDLVHISTPDHWHAKIAIEAMLAGKDVYCEKPMTLTIPEGREICDVCRKTGRIVQIGTQQRSDFQFVQAIALIQSGRLGKIQKAVCRIGGAPTSPEIPVAEPPADLDWNLWQGPVAAAPFRFLAGDNGETHSWSRGHYEFRWWYEYSGGKLTDWGAHHVDIATWGMGRTESGPVEIIPEFVRHPVEFRDGYPVDPARYNTATEFLIRARFADGAEIEIRHDGDNGILFEGTEGRLFVNRGRISGKPVEDLKSQPLPEGALEKAYKNRLLVDHFRNFFEAARDRVEPISDVFSHHRALSTCHLAGLAARLNRKLTWDPEREVIVGDAQAQLLLGRESRRGFEIGRG